MSIPLELDRATRREIALGLLRLFNLHAQSIDILLPRSGGRAIWICVLLTDGVINEDGVSTIKTELDGEPVIQESSKI